MGSANKTICIYYNFGETLTGSDNTMLSLIGALKELSFVNIILITNQKNKITDSISSEKVKVFYFNKVLSGDYKISKGINLLFNSLSFFNKIRKLKDSYNVDLFLVRSIFSVFVIFPSSYLFGIEYIWDIGFERKIIFDRNIKLSLLKRSRAVVCQYPSQVNDIFGEDIPEKYSDKIKAFVPGLSTNRSIEEITKQDRISSYTDVIKILCVAYIYPRKNQLEVLKIINSIGDDTFQAHFLGHVISKGYYQKLKNYVAANTLEKQVFFHGRSENVFSYMRNSHLLIIPSYDEGLPNVLREGMYAGNGVIASNNGGMKDFVKNYETGLIYKNGHISRVLNFLREVNKDRDKLSDIRDKAERSALSSFNNKKWSKSYKELVSNNL